VISIVFELKPKTVQLDLYLMRAKGTPSGQPARVRISSAKVTLASGILALT
jgi:hypothetical protein